MLLQVKLTGEDEDLVTAVAKHYGLSPTTYAKSQTLLAARQAIGQVPERPPRIPEKTEESSKEVA